MGQRREFVAPSSEAEQSGPPPSARSTSLPDSVRSFSGRYGPVLAAANFNVWPHALLLEADDSTPHWQRIGLDRNELFFLLTALSHYYAHESWPALSIERLARWLDLTERRVQQIKNTLIEDQYLRRVPRRDRDGNRRPDALDFTPLFALLEACLLRYHPDLITRDAGPIWLPPGPTAHPLDPDDFGRRRQEKRRRQKDARTKETTDTDDEASGLHPSGEISFTRGVQPDSPHAVQPVAPGGSSELHPASEAGCAGSETFVQRSPMKAGQKDRAVVPPGPSVPGSARWDSRSTSPVRNLPLNDQVTAIVEHHARAFRDDAVQQSVETAHHLWWNSRVPLQAFAELLDRAALVTKQTISSGRIRHGEPGARQAMPYFFRVLRTLCDEASARSATAIADASGQ